MSWIDEYGVEIEPPLRDEPPGKIHEMRATILFWHYLNRAGVSVRDIALCFGVGKSLVHRYISEIPDDIKEAYESDDFVGRLQAAFPEGRRPQSPDDVRRILQALRSGSMQGRTPLPPMQAE